MTTEVDHSHPVTGAEIETAAKVAARIEHIAHQIPKLRQHRGWRYENFEFGVNNSVHLHYSDRYTCEHHWIEIAPTYLTLPDEEWQTIEKRFHPQPISQG